MRNREIQEATLQELAKLTTPLSGETLDTIIMRLVKSYKRNGHAPGVAIAKGTHQVHTARKTNPDKLADLVRPKFKGLTYWQAAQKVFIASKQDRLGLLSITNSIFDFPNTPQKSDRVNRAVRSMSVALRGYTGGAASKTFKEPEVDVFELKKK